MLHFVISFIVCSTMLSTFFSLPYMRY